MMNWVLSVSLLPGKSIWLSSRPEKAMSARPSARAATIWRSISASVMGREM